MRIEELEGAPNWLRYAHTENADVILNRLGQVVWLRRLWLGGSVVAAAMWHGGGGAAASWRGGVWHGGVWRGGEWYGGVWCGGEWHGGVWRGGDVVRRHVVRRHVVRRRNVH